MPKKDEVLKFQQKPGGSTYRGAVYVTSGGGTTTNADTVDGFHASATATANTLLACDANGDLPTDITGDSDTVDGYDASDFLSPQYVTLAADGDLTNERVLTAGDGLDLTDGGAGSTVTLAVDVTDFIDTSYGLTENTNNIRVNNGTGMSFSGGALYAYGLMQSDYGAAALTADAAGDMTAYGGIAFNVAETISTNAGNLTLAPTGDLMLNPTGAQVRVSASHTLQSDNYASQTTGWGITYGGDGDFRYLYADELHAKAFIADLEQALAGGQIIAKSVAILSRDFTAPAASGSTTMYVWDLPSAENMAVFESGDIVRLRQFSRAAGSLSISDCWGVVTNYSNLADKEQSWTFTRSAGGDAGAMGAATTVYADSIVLDYGTDGNGYWEVNAIDGAYAVNSPYAQVVTWATHPHSGKTVRARLGQLTGITATDEYGLFAGDGVTATDSYMVLSDVGLEMHNLSTGWYDDEGTQRIGMDPGADPDAPDVMMWAGVSSTDPGMIVYGDGSMWLSTLAISDDAGAFLFSQADGRALWGPGCEITTSAWYSTRRQAATIAGAFHQVSGRWPNTQALVIEKATTNYETNPVFGSWTTGVPTGWAEYQSPTTTESTSYVRFHESSCRIQNPGAAAYRGIYDDVTGLSNGESYRVSVWVYIISGAAYLAAYDGATLNNVVSDTASTVGWHRLEVSKAATANGIRVGLWMYTASGDCYFDGVQVEHSAYATSLCWGGAGNGYSWAGTAHESTSARTATTVNLDAHWPIVSGNSTVSFRVMAQMAYDADATWPRGSGHNYLMALDGAAGSYIYLTYDETNDVFTASFNNSVGEITSSAQTFVAGDWIDLVLTMDYSADEYNLYVNGALDGSSTTSYSVQTLTTWNLGSNTSDAYQPGCAFSEYALFDIALTAEQVAALYALQRPLADAGNLRPGGLYLMDGQFTLASSTSDTRIEITNDQIAGYSGGTAQFYLSAEDGTAYCGGGDVILDADGITLALPASADDNDKIKWGTTYPYSYIHGEIYGGDGAGLYLIAETDTTAEPCVVELFAQKTGTGVASLQLLKDDSDNVSITIQSSSSAGTERVMLYADNGGVLINDSANTKNLAGLTINQSAADDEILALKSSDVAHGITDYTETDTYGFFMKREATSGGLGVYGYKDADGNAYEALYLAGRLGEAADTTKSTAGKGIISLDAAIKSGTGAAAAGTDANLVSIGTWGTTRFIFDAEGSAHADVEWTTFDEYDDLALLDTLEMGMTGWQAVKGQFTDWLTEHGAELEHLGLVHFDRDNPGHAMVNTTRLQMLLVGALRQVGDRLDRLERGQTCTN